MIAVPIGTLPFVLQTIVQRKSESGQRRWAALQPLTTRQLTDCELSLSGMTAPAHVQWFISVYDTFRQLGVTYLRLDSQFFPCWALPKVRSSKERRISRPS